MNLPDIANLSCSNKSLFGRSELCSLVTLRVERLLKVDLVHVRDFMSNDLDRFCDPYIIGVSKGHLVSNNNQKLTTRWRSENSFNFSFVHSRCRGF